MRVQLVTLALLLMPRAALACPVCTGQTDAPLARATTIGVAVMLGVVAFVLSGFAGLLWRLRRRALAAGAEC